VKRLVGLYVVPEYLIIRKYDYWSAYDATESTFDLGETL